MLGENGEKRQDAQIAGAQGKAAAALRNVGIVVPVLQNHVQQSAAGAVGAASTVNAPPISPSPGAPGKFRIIAASATTPGAGGSTCVAGDALVVQILRNGAPIGPANSGTLEAQGSTIPVDFDDAPGPGGPYTYAVRLTDATAPHTTQALAGSIIVQETL